MITPDRPHSVLIPHVPRKDTHGLIGTRPNCRACAEDLGPRYADRTDLHLTAPKETR